MSQRAGARSLLAALAFAVVAQGVPLRVAAGEIPQPGSLAPSFDLRRAGAQGNISLRQLRGRAVYLNFFASWCPPCNAEAPGIARVAKAFAAKGLTVIGVDEMETAKRALAFRDRYQLPYPILLDVTGTVIANYGGIGLPMHVFIDRAGRVVVVRFGDMTQRQLASNVMRLLKNP